MSQPTKKISDLADAISMVLGDKIIGTIGGEVKEVPNSVLLSFLYDSLVSLNELTVAGHLTAATLEGNGALLTNLVFTGSGGTESTGSLSLVCNSDSSTPLAKHVFYKDELIVANLDENSFRPTTGIPYSHDDDAIPFAKDINLDSNHILNTPTIAEMQRGKGLHFNGSQKVTIADDPNIDFGEGSGMLVGSIRIPSTALGTELRILTKGQGTQIYFCGIETDGRLSFGLRDSGSAVVVYSDDPIADGTIRTYALRFERGGLMTIMINGVLQSDTASTPPGTISGPEPLYFGRNNLASVWFKGEQYRHVFFNYHPSESEAKSWSSNPLKQLEWKDQGGSQVDLNTDANATADRAGTETNSIGNWVAVISGSSVFQSQSSVVHNGAYALEININPTPGSAHRCVFDMGTYFGCEVGKFYRLTFWWRHVGTGGNWIAAMGEGDGSSIATTIAEIEETDTTFEKVTIDFEFFDDWHLKFREFNTSNNGGIYFDDLSINQLGCIAEYRPDGISTDIWFEAQIGNDGVIDADVINDFSSRDGTWVPVVSDASSGGNLGVPSSVSGLYSRNGKTVTVSGHILNIDTSGMTAGNYIYIQGLPRSAYGTPPSVGQISLSSTTFNGYCYLYINGGSNIIRIGNSVSGSGLSFLLISQLTSGSADLRFSITYQIG